MELKNRNALIYGLLLGVWVLVVAWLTAEHLRVREATRVGLVNRAQDISTTLGIVLRSQRRFGGVVSKERLEASLAELLKQEKTELIGIALLNAAGEVGASSGAGIDLQAREFAGTTEHWDAQTVTLLNQVDLGTNLTYDIEGTNLLIILSRQDFTNRFATNRMGLPPPGPPPEASPEPRPMENPSNPVAVSENNPGGMPPP